MSKDISRREFLSLDWLLSDEEDGSDETAESGSPGGRRTDDPRVDRRRGHPDERRWEPDSGLGADSLSSD